MELARPEGVSEEVAGWGVRVPELDLAGIASVQAAGKTCYNVSCPKCGTTMVRE